MIFEEEGIVLVNDISKKTFYIALIPLMSSLFAGEIPSVTGMLYGLIISLLLFRLKYIHISRAVDMDSARAETFIRNRYYINYSIYFIVLLTAYRSPKLNFIAAVIGILLIKFVIIGLSIIDVLQEKWNRKKDLHEERRFL